MDNQQLSAWIGLRSERNIHTWINQHDVVYTNWRPTELNANGSVRLPTIYFEIG